MLKAAIDDAVGQVFKSESTNTGIRRQSSLNLVVDFLHLLEALMLEYLSDSWDKVDKVGSEYHQKPATIQET